MIRDFIIRGAYKMEIIVAAYEFFFLVSHKFVCTLYFHLLLLF